jgi:sugar-specific transcriptional regulator TrmB
MDFSELGLTKNETKAYKTLLKLGKTSASKISTESDVAYGRIYDVLASLESKGLVKVIPEKTKKFMPADPKQLQEVIKNKKQKLDELGKEILEMKTIYDTHEDEPVQIVRGQKNFYKLLREVKSSKEREFNIKHTFNYFPENVRNVKHMIKNKVDYKVIGRIDKETENNIKKWKKITPNIKPINNEGVAMSMMDGEKLLLVLIKSNVIMLIKDKPFIKLMEELFQCYYEHN